MLSSKMESPTLPEEILKGAKPDKLHRPFNRNKSEELIAPGIFSPPLVPYQTQANTMNMQAMLAALKRRWMMTACFAIIAGSLAGILGWVLVPNKFQAYGTLQVAMAPIPLLTVRADSRNDFSVFMKTQAARIKSRDVLLRALKQDQVRNLQLIKHFPDTLSVLTWLEDEIKIDFQDGNELLTLTVSGDDPEELVILANGLMNSYLGIINGKETQEKKDRAKKLQDIVVGARDKLKDKYDFRRSLVPQGVNDHITLAAKLQNYQGQLAEANRELYRLQIEEEKIKQKIVAINLTRRNISEEDVPEHVIRPMLEADPVIKDKLTRQASASNVMQRMRKAGTPVDNSYFRATKDEYVLLSKELERSKQIIRTELLDRVRRKNDSEQQSLLEIAKAEQGPILMQIKKIKDRMGALQSEVESLGGAVSQIEQVSLDIQQDEKKLGGLIDQQQLFQIEVESEPRVSTCQDAVWQIKDARKRLIIVMIIPLFSVGLVCLGVAWFECKTGKIQSADEVAKQFGLRVVGTIPPLRHSKIKKINSFFEMDMNSGRDLIESVDCIRTMILRRQTEDPTNLIMVTSAAGGEGKSTFAYNVAVSIAAMGKKTLLIDCDFRAPALHQVFEQTLQPGFCEILAEEVPYTAAVRPTTTHPNLFFLPAGQWDREVIQELATPTFTELINQLKMEYEFIIIDSHPLLAATDSLLIAQHVDTVLISVLRNVSRSPLVSNALSKLSALEVPVLGAVVNGIPPEMIRA